MNNIVISILALSLATSVGCAKKDPMNNPYEIKEVNAGTNYMLEKIDKGEVRWYNVSFKKGDRVEAQVMLSKTLGIQLHMDLLYNDGNKPPKIAATGTDDGVQSRVKMTIPSDGNYFVRVFDKGLDEGTKGLLSGYTFYISKR